MRVTRQTLVAIIFGSITASTVLIAASCSSESDDGAIFEDTYDTYFGSFSYDYNPARSLADLAEKSTIATKATLVDVEEGRLFAVADAEPEIDPNKPVPAEFDVKLNLVFETTDSVRYYVQLPRPNDSSVAQLRSVLPVGEAGVIYLRPNDDPIVDGEGRWFNIREDGNEWFFTTPQGWILDHPDRGIVLPLEGIGIPFAEMPTSTETLDDWFAQE